MSLRLATRVDIPTLEHLIEASGRGLSTGFYTPEQTEAITRHVFGVDSRLIDDGTYFVIEHEGRIVACGGWSRRVTLFGADRYKGDVDPLLDPAREPARIRAFFVDPTMARRGLGRQLLDACTQAATAAGFRALELAATLPGVPLYRNAGFDAIENFDLELPGDVRVPLVRMRREI
ncbi:GNAT family N-acetyltransferase [Lysobacter humi (ex Lee et al. 2017)]